MGYLTQKQLTQLSKYKKEQDSDRDSLISGHSNKGRRMKLRHVMRALNGKALGQRVRKIWEKLRICGDSRISDESLLELSSQFHESNQGIILNLNS